MAVIPPYDEGQGVIKRSIIKDPANIAAIGEARIAQLVKDGFMEWIPWTEEVAAFLQNDAKPFDAATGEGSLAVADADQAQEVAQNSYTASLALKEKFGQAADSISAAVPVAPASIAGK